MCHHFPEHRILMGNGYHQIPYRPKLVEVIQMPGLPVGGFHWLRMGMLLMEQRRLFPEGALGQDA
jgi:hypothetical protein